MSGPPTNTSSSRSNILFDAFLPTTQIPKNHLTIGYSNYVAQSKQTNELFRHKKLPTRGWSDVDIQTLLLMLANLDTNFGQPLAHTNNDDDDGAAGGGGGVTANRWVGCGEREGRVYANLVFQRHYGFSHGIGRSGDVTEPQPKAVGSSIIAELTKCLVLDAMKSCCHLNGKAKKHKGRGKTNENANNNINNNNNNSSSTIKHGPVTNGIVLPLCTGMSMSLVLSSLKHQPSPSTDTGGYDERNIVLWSRIDQKSCFKAVQSAGLICIVVPTKLDDDKNTTTDQVVTDIHAMELLIEQYSTRVLAIISTTSCFAPRVPDSIDEIGKLCARYTIHHVINNAYGLQCEHTCKLLNRACVVGRVDAIICSTDKNFLVPVGGAVVTSPSKDIITNIGKLYAGRASGSPTLDLFITMLSMGRNGYTSLLMKRKQLRTEFQTKFEQIAHKWNERLLICPKNTISFGITLNTLADTTNDKDDNEDGDDTEDQKKECCLSSSCSQVQTNNDALITSSFGSMLFTRCVSGTRVVPKAQRKLITGTEFVGFGSSTANFPHSYLTAACALGFSSSELHEFMLRLDKCFKDFHTKKKKKQKHTSTTTTNSNS